MGYPTVTHTVSVYRLTRTGNKDQYSTIPVYTGIEAGIFPAGTDILAVYPAESAFALCEIFIYEPCTLKNGDKLTMGVNEWIVRGVPQVFASNRIHYQRVIGEKVVGT
jgi:hypothetical protein